MDLMSIVATVLIIAVLGVCVGILSGMLGIGGGIQMVLIFRLLFGLSAVVSTATSLFAIIPTSISGVSTHIRQKTCVPKLGLALGLGGACTSPLGVYLNHLSPAWLVMLACGLIMLSSAFTMLKKGFAMKPASKNSKGGEAAKAAETLENVGEGTEAIDAAESAGKGAGGAGACEEAGEGAGEACSSAEKPKAASEPTSAYEVGKKKLMMAAGIGALAGVASGYAGVGGGFLMVPLMVSFLGLPMRLTSGTSLIAIMILAIPGTIENAMIGSINYTTGLIFALGTIPGALMGARLVKIIPERALRLIFGFILLPMAFILVINELGVF